METEGSKPQSAAQWIYKNDKKHKGGMRQVLLALAACMDDENNCPSFSDLADMTQLSRGAVQHALRELEKDGTITSEKNGGKKKQGGTTNCYYLGGFPQAPDEESGSLKSVPVESVVLKSVVLKSTLPTDPLQHETTPETPPETLSAEFDKPEISTTEYAGARGSLVNINKDTQTTTTTTVVVVPDDKSPPNDDDKPMSEQVGDLGEVARAYDKYMPGSMNSQSAKIFEVLIEDYSAVKVVEAFKAAFGKNDPWAYALWWLKNPDKVDKPKTPTPTPKPVAILTEAEKESFRRQMNHDVPIFKPIGATP